MEKASPKISSTKRTLMENVVTLDRSAAADGASTENVVTLKEIAAAERESTVIVVILAEKAEAEAGVAVVVGSALMLTTTKASAARKNLKRTK